MRILEEYEDSLIDADLPEDDDTPRRQRGRDRSTIVLYGFAVLLGMALAYGVFLVLAT